MASYPPVAPENGAKFTSILHKSSYPFIKTAKHDGHRILITGGARGIGKAIALSFARAGAKAIAVADITESSDGITSELSAAAKEGGHTAPQIVLINLDVTDEESVRKCAETVKSQFGGKLDILINNAGYMTAAFPVPESDTTTWWRTFEVNLKGVYLMSKHFIPLLLSTPEGPRTMISISSIAAHAFRMCASAYGTSKLAALRLTEFLMAETAEKGLLAYCVHPGAVLTTLAKEGMPPETFPVLDDDIGLAGDTIAWLTSERREWLAGRYISSTWDMKELLDRRSEIEEGDKLKIRLIV
ncbi:oxidoreductase-like protein [Hypomontagnella submonticulosa]|nr:oxidoreductase-like protein [Hypomontagnella submonticulosa]